MANDPTKSDDMSSSRLNYWKVIPLSLATCVLINLLSFEAHANVMKAEMLLEDARKKRQNGVEPLPGERTGNANGSSRLNDQYKARQLSLEQEVAEAEAMLKKTVRERDALQGSR